MELTFKQKAAVFGVMLAIFLFSVFAKQWIDGRSIEKAEAAGGSAITQSSEAAEGSENEGKAETAQGTVIVLDVEGAVTYPGIVKVNEGSRVYEAVEKAGGLLETADTKYVNLAEEVTDGSIIYIPFEGENTAGSAGTGPTGGADQGIAGGANQGIAGGANQGASDASAAGNGAGGAGGSGSGGSGNGLININTADQATLMTLSGIGEAYAQAIIDYRTQNGSFKNKEDIKKVSGIGDATYEKLKDKICTY